MLLCPWLSLCIIKIFFFWNFDSFLIFIYSFRRWEMEECLSQLTGQMEQCPQHPMSVIQIYVFVIVSWFLWNLVLTMFVGFSFYSSQHHPHKHKPSLWRTQCPLMKVESWWVFFCISRIVFFPFFSSLHIRRRIDKNDWNTQICRWVTLWLELQPIKNNWERVI